MSPNTGLEHAAIISLLQATGVYNSVEKGEPPDYTDLVAAPLNAACSVCFVEDESEHDASGGLVEDTQGFRVRTVINLTDHVAAETLLESIRDTIIPIFQKHSTLNATSNVIFSIIKPRSMHVGYLMANGKLYRAHEFIVQPTSEWFVPGGVTD